MLSVNHLVVSCWPVRLQLFDVQAHLGQHMETEDKISWLIDCSILKDKNGDMIKKEQITELWFKNQI